MEEDSQQWTAVHKSASSWGSGRTVVATVGGVQREAESSNPATPIRHRLPPELFIYVTAVLRTSLPNSPFFQLVDGITPLHEALRNLSLTSRTFRALAQPILFEAIHFMGPNPAFRAHKIGQIFDARSESCAWIKHLQIHVCGEEVERLFLRMIGLQSITFGPIALSSPMYSHLYRLSELVTLHLQNVTLHTEHLDLPPTEELKLKELSMGCRYPTYTPPTAITRLSLSPLLETLTIPNFNSPFYEDLTGRSISNTFPSLTTLHLIHRSIQFSRLVSFAAQCPNLQALETRGRGSIEVPQTIGPSALPGLRRCTGPLNVAQLLVPGRPLEVLHLVGGGEWSKDALVPLSQGSVTLRELGLSMDKYKATFMNDLRDLFKNLEVLRVSFDNVAHEVRTDVVLFGCHLLSILWL